MSSVGWLRRFRLMAAMTVFGVLFAGVSAAIAVLAYVRPASEQPAVTRGLDSSPTSSPSRAPATPTSKPSAVSDTPTPVPTPTTANPVASVSPAGSLVPQSPPMSPRPDGERSRETVTYEARPNGAISVPIVETVVATAIPTPVQAPVATTAPSVSGCQQTNTYTGSTSINVNGNANISVDTRANSNECSVPR
jgi:cytoskeletal protein RodZ